ncbi:MAG: hypothetical protein ABIO70_07265 [Pseudomonadota bacterium]
MRASILVSLALLPAGCPARLPFDTAEPVPDFALRDVNPTSPTFDDPVSVRGQLGRVSAWYFGHSS